MKRRDFLKSTGLVSTGLLLPGFLKGMDPGITANGRRLVILQFSGGNDGLNTIVPYRNDIYHSLRPKLGIAQDKVLRLSDDMGLHPVLTHMQALHGEGRFACINGVGYPNPDRSHFRSMDIWHTASGSGQVLTNGWLGRFLDSECTHAHEVIEFGPRLSLANKGAQRSAIALTDPQRFFKATREPYFQRLASDAAAGHAADHPPLGYLYKTMVDTYQSAAYIQEKLGGRTPVGAFPKTELGKQLGTIATCIRTGMETRAYYASFSGFDTHVNQKVKHAEVLRQVDAALGAFVKELKDSGDLKSTLIMVFSEFGRRVKENASNGTDHGTAGNVWLISDSLGKPGAYNAIPSLSDLDANGDLKFSVDFRSVYATVLDRWLGVDPHRILSFEAPLLNGLI